MKELWRKIAELPRVAKWLIAFGIVLGLWFWAVVPVLNKTEQFAIAADDMESKLRLLGTYESEESETARVVKNGMKAFGRPRLPSDSQSTELGIQRAVGEVLDDHGVDERNMTERNGSLGGDFEADLAIDSAFYRVERAIVEVTFETTQETVVQIIADLERSPAVSAITRIKIDKSTASWSTPDGEEQSERKVRATIAAEAWVRVKKSGTGGESAEEGIS